MEVSYSWDSTKAERNRRLHGISFEQAIQIFDDPCHIVIENYYFSEDGEQRYQAIGRSGDLLLLTVIFVDRSDEHHIRLRFITARKVTRYEESLYQEASA